MAFQAEFQSVRDSSAILRNVRLRLGEAWTAFGLLLFMPELKAGQHLFKSGCKIAYRLPILVGLPEGK